jgi:hypothetical protein
MTAGWPLATAVPGTAFAATGGSYAPLRSGHHREQSEHELPRERSLGTRADRVWIHVVPRPR